MVKDAYGAPSRGGQIMPQGAVLNQSGQKDPSEKSAGDSVERAVEQVDRVYSRLVGVAVRACGTDVLGPPEMANSPVRPEGVLPAIAHDADAILRAAARMHRLLEAIEAKL